MQRANTTPLKTQLENIFGLLISYVVLTFRTSLTMIYFDDTVLVDQEVELSTESSDFSVNNGKRICTTVSRPGRYKKVLFPMIPKQDLRRTIALMYTNVFNSGDILLTRQFYEQYFHPDCSLYRKDGTQTQQLTSCRSGTYAMGICLLSFMPDVVSMLQTVQVLRPKPYSKECSVIMHSCFSGTQILDPNWLSVSLLLQQYCQESVENLLQEISAVMCNSPFSLQSPQAMSCLGYTTLHMNDNMIVERVEYTECQ